LVVGNESQVLAWHQTRQGAERLKELISGSAVSRLAGLESSPEKLRNLAEEIQPEVILLEMGEDLNGLMTLVDQVRRVSPRSWPIVLSQTKDPDLILKAMRLGVREYMVEPTTSQDFNDAILRLRRVHQAPGKAAGVLISCMGAKGGVGTSHICLNLAWSLSQQEKMSTVLVDLDLAGGDLAYLLDLEPDRNLADVSQNIERLDAVFMENLLSEVGDGLHLLGAPPDPVVAEEVRAEHVERGLQHLADNHRFVIMDLPSRIDEVTLTALDLSDVIVMIVEPTLVGLKAARRTLGLSKRLGHDQSKVNLVVNRFGSKGSLAKRDVEKALGREVLAWLDNDSRTLLAAGNAGRPALVGWPRSPWCKQVVKLAQALCDLTGGRDQQAADQE
jgi:pilus assembly protein CpaE